MTNPEKSVEEIAFEIARSIESRLVHKLQTETMSTTGQSIDYRKGLRDMRYLVMEHCKELAEIDLLPILQAERQKRDEAVEAERERIRNKLNTVRFSDTWNCDVVMWRDIIEALTQPNNQEEYDRITNY